MNYKIAKSKWNANNANEERNNATKPKEEIKEEAKASEQANSCKAIAPKDCNDTRTKALGSRLLAFVPKRKQTGRQAGCTGS